MFFSKENREKRRIKKSLKKFVNISNSSLGDMIDITENEIHLIIWHIIGASNEAHKHLEIDKDMFYDLTKDYLLKSKFDKKMVLTTLGSHKAKIINGIQSKYLDLGSKNFKKWKNDESTFEQDALYQLITADRRLNNNDSEKDRYDSMMNRAVDIIGKYGERKD